MIQIKETDWTKLNEIKHRNKLESYGDAVSFLLNNKIVYTFQLKEAEKC